MYTYSSGLLLSLVYCYYLTHELKLQYQVYIVYIYGIKIRGFMCTWTNYEKMALIFNTMTGRILRHCNILLNKLTVGLILYYTVVIFTYFNPMLLSEYQHCILLPVLYRFSVVFSVGNADPFAFRKSFQNVTSMLDFSSNIIYVVPPRKFTVLLPGI